MDPVRTRSGTPGGRLPDRPSVTEFCQPQKSVRLFRIYLRHFFKRRQRFVLLSLLRGNQARHVQKIRLEGLNRQRALNGLARFLGPVHGKMNLRLLRIGKAIARIFLQGLIQQFERIGKSILPRQIIRLFDQVLRLRLIFGTLPVGLRSRCKLVACACRKLGLARAFISVSQEEQRLCVERRWSRRRLQHFCRVLALLQAHQDFCQQGTPGQIFRLRSLFCGLVRRTLNSPIQA